LGNGNYGINKLRSLLHDLSSLERASRAEWTKLSQESLVERNGVLVSKTRTDDDASPNLAPDAYKIVRAARKPFRRHDNLVVVFRRRVYVVGVRRRGISVTPVFICVTIDSSPFALRSEGRHPGLHRVGGCRAALDSRTG
jgi:hypothetical protein